MRLCTTMPARQFLGKFLQNDGEPQKGEQQHLHKDGMKKEHELGLPALSEVAGTWGGTVRSHMPELASCG